MSIISLLLVKFTIKLSHSNTRRTIRSWRYFSYDFFDISQLFQQFFKNRHGSRLLSLQNIHQSWNILHYFTHFRNRQHTVILHYLFQIKNPQLILRRGRNTSTYLFVLNIKPLPGKIRILQILMIKLNNSLVIKSYRISNLFQRNPPLKNVFSPLFVLLK